MTMAKTIVGLDIGATLRAVEVHRGSGRPTVVRHAELALPEGAVRRGEVIEVSTVASAVRRLWSEGGFRTKEVALGIGGTNVIAREMSLPRAPLAQLRETLPFQVQELLPMPVSDAVLDFYPISEEAGEAGPMVSGLLVAAIKDAVSTNVAAVTQAGLRPVHVDLIPFAVTRAVAPVATAKGRFAIVDIGATTTNVVVVDHGVPQYVRIIPSGADDITKAIAQRQQWQPEQAERAKRALGIGAGMLRQEDRPIIEIIYQVVGELLANIRNTLNYYATAKPAAPLSHVVLAGGGSRLTGLATAMGEVVGLPADLAPRVEGAERGARGDRERHETVDLTTAFGIALGAR